jgi:hypothetical protein
MPLMHGRSRVKTVIELGLASLSDRDACKRVADAMWAACVG